MPIAKKPMQPILVEYNCDTCGSPMVKRKNSNVYYTDPPQYDYECRTSKYTKPPEEHCPDKRLYGEFPRIEYITEDE